MVYLVYTSGGAFDVVVQISYDYAMKTQYVYLLLPIPNLRGNHAIAESASSGKPNPGKRQNHFGA